MTNQTNFKPPGFTTVTPYIIAERAERLFEFLEQTFNGVTKDRTLEDGKVRHGAVLIEDSMVEFAEARPEWPAAPCAVHIYVPDTDAAYRRALKCGATSIFEPADQPYGERSAGVQDPTGSSWYLATYTG